MGCAFGCQVGFIAVEHFGIVGGGVVVRIFFLLWDSEGFRSSFRRLCVCLCGCCFLGGGGAGEGRKGAARGGGREIERDRERRIIILKEEKEKGGGSSGDRDRESVSSGLIAGKGGRWR